MLFHLLSSLILLGFIASPFSILRFFGFSTAFLLSQLNYVRHLQAAIPNLFPYVFGSCNKLSVSDDSVSDLFEPGVLVRVDLNVGVWFAEGVTGVRLLQGDGE